MGNTRDLFKRIGDIKGTFHGRIDMIKHRNGKDLTEVEEIKLLSGHRTEKVSFQSNSKEGQCQRMSKLSQNCVHFRCQEGYAQNTSSQTSAVCELRTSRCTSWVQETEKPEIKLPTFATLKGKQGNSRKTSAPPSLTKAFDCVDHKKLENS